MICGTVDSDHQAMNPSVTVSSLVERHDPKLPRFVVVPSGAISSWRLEETTTVEGALEGVSIGRRSLKKWDEGRWFLDLPGPLCRRAGVDTGDSVELSLRVASTELPEELSRVLAEPRARIAWELMTAGQQRMLREHVRAARHPETRDRRARRALIPIG